MTAEEIIETGKALYETMRRAEHKPSKTVQLLFEACNALQKFQKAMEEIAGLESECCPRCEGKGRLWADGKAHFPYERVDTIPCGRCGGSGRILPDAQSIARQALKPK